MSDSSAGSLKQNRRNEEGWRCGDSQPQEQPRQRRNWGTWFCASPYKGPRQWWAYCERIERIANLLLRAAANSISSSKIEKMLGAMTGFVRTS